MKKLILSLAFAIVAFASSAQWYVGGTAGLSIQTASNGDESASATAFALVPEFGYKFNDKWSAGLALGINCSSTASYNTIVFSPYARYSFAQAGPVRFFAEAAAGIEGAVINSESIIGWAVALRPGMEIKINDKIDLVGRTTLLKYSSVDIIKQTGFAINPSLEFGIIFKL